VLQKSYLGVKMNKKTSSPQSEGLAPAKAASLVLDEARMFLPGIQALFGFQLVAVFNQGFSEKLTTFEQRLHLLAIALIVITTITILTPAAYQRQMEVQHVTERFIQLATRLLLVSMVPFATSICLDFYIISRLILNHSVLALIFSVVLYILFLVVWFGLPRLGVLHKLADDA
jgi:hypothetical protein